MDIFTNLTVMKIRSLGIVMGLLFHSMVTNGYNMKSMENSGEKLFKIFVDKMNNLYNLHQYSFLLIWI